MKILAISGSLRRDSHNAALLRAAVALLPPAVEVVTYESLAEIPAFNEDDVPRRPPAAQDLWDAVDAADGVLISTPEYNSSIPGVLKNALDWLSRPLVESPLRNKPAVVIGGSTGMFGAIWAQAETRKVLSAIGARAIDRELPVASIAEQFHESGRLSDSELEAELVISLTALTDAIEARERSRAAAG